MYHHTNGWDGGWLWMLSLMLLWLVVLAGIACAALRLALEHARKPPLRH